MKSWMGDPEIYLLDMRGPRDGDVSPAKIEHARHFDLLEPVETWSRKLPREKKIVAYCA